MVLQAAPAQERQGGQKSLREHRDAPDRLGAESQVAPGFAAEFLQGAEHPAGIQAGPRPVAALRSRQAAQERLPEPLADAERRLAWQARRQAA